LDGLNSALDPAEERTSETEEASIGVIWTKTKAEEIMEGK
jgi:hypothetical protein